MGKVDDLALARKMEIEIDDLRNTTDPQILQLASDAAEALKRRQLDTAQALISDGQERTRPVRLVDVLVRKGKLQSNAHAVRLVLAGMVLVDGKVPKNPEQNVRDALSIRIRGSEGFTELLGESGAEEI